MPNELSGLRALVTGARGFLGGNLVRRLVDEGVEVHAVTREQPPADADLTWWQCDAVDEDAVRDLVTRVAPDVVYHFGGVVTGNPGVELVAPTYHSLLTSTINVLIAITELGHGRLVLAGSLEEPEGETPDDLVPANPYGAAKFAASMYGRMFGHQYGTPVAVLRPYVTYGPRQRPEKLIVATILSLLEGERPVVHNPHRALDWVYVDDVVDAFVTAATHQEAVGRTFDLGSGAAVSVHSVAERLAGLIAPELAPPPAGPGQDAGLVRLAQTEPAASVLGWRATTTLDAGLAATVEWYRTDAAGIASDRGGRT